MVSTAHEGVHSVEDGEKKRGRGWLRFLGIGALLAALGITAAGYETADAWDSYARAHWNNLEK